MNIIVNATCLLQPVTGIGRYTYNLMMALSQITNLNAHYLYFRVLSDELKYSGDTKIRVSNLKKIIKTLIPQTYRFSLWRQQQSFNKGVKRFKPDLYHEPNFLPLKFNGPTVVTIHDLSVFRYPEMHPNERVKQFNDMLPSVLDKADALIVDSEYVRKELIDHFTINQSKIFTTLLGVSDVFFLSDKNIVLDTLLAHNLSYKNYLLVVGTLEPRKNLNTILNSYQRLSNKIRDKYPLVIAGVRGWKLELLDIGLKKLINKEQVRLLGYVNDYELPHLYAGAKAFIFPSKYEGFGLPPLEAMASGTPVIASNCSSIPEVVGNTGILVEPEAVTEWTNAIKRLLEDSELEQRMIYRGLQRAREFTWNRCAKQTLAAYEHALGYPLKNH